MKKTLLSLLVALGMGSAHAGLYVANSSAGYTTSGFGIPGMPGELTYVSGTLMASQAGTLTFSYLGSEAGHSDSFFGSSAGSFNNKSSTNNAFSMTTTGGPLSFYFKDVTSNTLVSNGGIYSQDFQNSFGLKQESNNSYLLLYNDYVKHGDKDFDDMVVRVVFAPVPEPESYAMFLAGLGLMGVIALRRQKNV